MSQLPAHGIKPWVVLITRDRKLCTRVLDTVNHRDQDVHHYVVAVDPDIYLLGRLAEIEGRRVRGWLTMPPTDDCLVIQDPGAIIHADYTNYEDGGPAEGGRWWPIGQEPLYDEMFTAPITEWWDRNDILSFDFKLS